MTTNNYKNVIKTLDKYGVSTTKQMKKILIKKNKRATGRLINSIEYDILKDKKNNYALEITYAYYGQFVSGRNEKNEQGHPPRWKNKGPRVDEIKKWLRAKNIPYRQNGRGKKPSRQKQIDIMAYLIVRKIKRDGKLSPAHNNPTDFVKPYDRLGKSSKFVKEIQASLARDGQKNIGLFLKNNKYDNIKIDL